MPAEPGSVGARILAWFGAHGRRDLPWQIDSDPYRVWVSEIMLQQTQVATVIPYFERFVAAFPDVSRLAAASIDEALALWSGLGYYARARNLHRSARIVASELGGEIPKSMSELMALPGIGRSTAGAILALARGQRHPILDGNVKRVLARYHAVRGWPGAGAVEARLWELAERHTPHARVSEYTQAIMDLGATVCTRANPRCNACPIAGSCAAFRAGLQAELPSPRPKRSRRRRMVTALIVRNGDGEILLERRPEHGVWGGLLSFPELDGEESIDAWCVRRLGARANAIDRLAPVEHAFTHFDLTLNPVCVELASSHAIMDCDRWLWYKSAQAAPGGIAAPIARLLEGLTGPDERRIA